MDIYHEQPKLARRLLSQARDFREHPRNTRLHRTLQASAEASTVQAAVSVEVLGLVNTLRESFDSALTVVELWLQAGAQRNHALAALADLWVFYVFPQGKRWRERVNEAPARQRLGCDLQVLQNAQLLPSSFDADLARLGNEIPQGVSARAEVEARRLILTKLAAELIANAQAAHPSPPPLPDAGAAPAPLVSPDPLASVAPPAELEAAAATLVGTEPEPTDPQAQHVPQASRRSRS